jgi:hypothetical protein
MRMWHLVTAASILGAGAVAAACSSSSSGGGGTDSGADSAGDDGGGDGAVACTANPISSATVDGGASWACIEAACHAELTACAADCPCNNAVLTALQCIATMGAAATTSCFTTGFTPIIADTTVTPLVTCLQGHSAGCGGPVVDGGPDAHSDAPTGDAPAGDAPTGDAPASDAPTGDAPTGDAPTGDAPSGDASDAASNG